MNLTKQPPRRPTNRSMAGVVGVARMVDKARAHNRDTLGQYLYGNDSGLDQRVLDFLDITAETLAQLVSEKDDLEVDQWLSERVKRSSQEIEDFNQSELSRLPIDNRHRQLLKERLAKYAPNRTDIKTVLQSMELDDWGNFWQVDLQALPPRSPYNREVAGMFGVARMADKARATKCGKNGDYKYGQSSAFDQYFLQVLGLDQDQFQQFACANLNDKELSGKVLSKTSIDDQKIAVCNQQARTFGLQAESESDVIKRPYQSHFYRENFEYRRSVVAPNNEQVENWLDLMDYDDQQSFGIMDLARRPPRSPYSQAVLGVAHLARLIDKGRACISGTLGDYQYGSDSAIDRHALAFLAIKVDEFTVKLEQLSTDQQVSDWIKDRSSKTDSQIAEFNGQILALGPTDDGEWSSFRRMMEQLDSHRADIKTYFELMVLEDERAFQFP